MLSANCDLAHQSHSQIQWRQTRDLRGIPWGWEWQCRTFCSGPLCQTAIRDLMEWLKQKFKLKSFFFFPLFFPFHLTFAMCESPLLSLKTSSPFAFWSSGSFNTCYFVDSEGKNSIWHSVGKSLKSSHFLVVFKQFFFRVILENRVVLEQILPFMP